MKRAITFEQAKARFTNRFTMEHVPPWAKEAPDATPPISSKRPGYYAPQFRTDREWYDNTRFKGEPGHLGTARECTTSGQTWPLGQWLDEPFKRSGK